jgi:hypothetical protein
MEKRIDDIFEWLEVKGSRYIGTSLICFAAYFLIMGVCR